MEPVVEIDRRSGKKRPRSDKPQKTKNINDEGPKYRDEIEDKHNIVYNNKLSLILVEIKQLKRERNKN